MPSVLTAALAALVVGVPGVTAPATAWGSQDDWLPEIAASASIEGPVVIAGRLETRRGAPSAGRLSLVAWPTQDVLGDTRTGDTIKLLPVAKAFAGSDGRFKLRVDPRVSLAEVTNSAGVVNFDVLADGPTGVAVHSFPRRLVTGAASRWAAVDDGPRKAAGLDVPIRLDDGPPLEASDEPPPGDKLCTTTATATWDLRPTTVGELYTGPAATGDVIYRAGSDSTVGVGYSLTGQLGSWSQSGTMSTWSTQTENFPAQGHNSSKTYQTYFGWKRWNTVCMERGAYWSYHQARAYEYQGGQVLWSAIPPAAGYCLRYPAGGGVTRESGTAWTHTTGVRLASVLGIDLSSRTGFDSATKVTYAFTAKGRLCGTNSYPGSAQRVVAKGP
jgi:hypothetical protein